jgi:UDP-GlcNAc3NAcA epimerase
MKKRLLTVVGARPQFVKAAALSRRLADPRFADLDEALCHTGQHYDREMSQSFFDDLGIPAPRWNLAAGSGSHGAQTGAIMRGLETVVEERRPDIVLVYGDTNSTLAAALVAAKAGIALAHVEAGLRSYRRAMPEEINRVVTDRLSDLLFCPTDAAVANLAREGIVAGVHRTGDIMLDTFRHTARTAPTDAHRRFGLAPRGFVLATLHRAENVDDPGRLRALLDGLAAVAAQTPVLLPLHPRTRKAAEGMPALAASGLVLSEPLSHPEIVGLLGAAAAVATDSGGLQKEAYFAGVRCVTLREETEWTETLEGGWNRLAAGSAAAVAAAIRAALAAPREPGPPPVYGDGDAAGQILAVLART